MSLYEKPQLHYEVSGNIALAGWQRQRRTTISESVSKRDIGRLFNDYSNLPYANVPQIKRKNMHEAADQIRETLVDHKVQYETRRLLLKAFEARAQQEGISMGVWTLEELQLSCEEVNCADMVDVDIVAKNYLLPDEYQRKFRILPENAQRELVSEILAQRRSEAKALDYIEERITEKEIMSQVDSGDNVKKKEKGKTQFGNHVETSMQANRLTERPEVLIGKSQPARYDVTTWLTLPIKPLLIPNGEPVNVDNPHDLASYLWTKILYSPQFVDRNGREVAMDDASANKYIEKIQQFIERGEPIRASEYTPLIAIPNPLKRRTQEITLAEIDFFRRLAEASMAVSLFYPPGLRWEVINEIPAFSEAFNIDPKYLDSFHNDCEQIAKSINCTMGTPTIHLTRMDDYLGGENALEFKKYKQQQFEQIYKALYDNSHPDHGRISKEISTFIYPMATCINPLDCEAARQMKVSEIVAVYEKLRQLTGSEIRGVGLGTATDIQAFTPEQHSLLEYLKQKGLELSINYRITMGARDTLPSFGLINNTIKYTMVTKVNKPVLFPNSHRGPSFPAHGESILIPNDGGWPTVTVKPWIQVLTGKDEFNTRPNQSEVTGDVLYFS